jgi:Stress responsive A/B Barrel Domain
MTTRKNFLKTLTTLLGISLLPINKTKGMDKAKSQFVHQVYFWLKEPDNVEHRKKLVEGLKTLTAIKTLRQYHIGVPAGKTRDVVDASYTISWLTIFEDGKGQDAYQVDPIHLAFVEKYSYLWDRVLVYDSKDL